MPVTDTTAIRAAGMRRLRKGRGWSMRYVAELFQKDQSAVCRWENGERTPPSAYQIGTVFGVTPAEVLARCEHCNYNPPDGYQCLRCGMKGRPL